MNETEEGEKEQTTKNDTPNALQQNPTSLTFKWLEILLPKSNDLKIRNPTKTTKQPSSDNDHDRVLPVVLFPFFLHSLKLKTNPAGSFSLGLLNDLKTLRNKLYLQQSSFTPGGGANSLLLNSLDVTINQLDLNIHLLLIHTHNTLCDIEFDHSVSIKQLELKVTQLELKLNEITDKDKKKNDKKGKKSSKSKKSKKDKKKSKKRKRNDE